MTAPRPASEDLIQSLKRDVIIIVGGYGSGKSEVAVNLARVLSQGQDRPVAIADLDIVNPYFRSREAAGMLDRWDIKSIVPPGEQAQADLPIILPEIKGAIEAFDGKVILDVGGDDTGARVLSSLADGFKDRSRYDMLLVLNANRPFTANRDACLSLIGQIEGASRLRFTGLVSNTHLMDQTDADTVRSGLKLAEEVSTASKLPVFFYSAVAEIIEDMRSGPGDCPGLALTRMLLKPWEQSPKV